MLVRALRHRKWRPLVSSAARLDRTIPCYRKPLSKQLACSTLGLVAARRAPAKAHSSFSRTKEEQNKGSRPRCFRNGQKLLLFPPIISRPMKEWPAECPRGVSPDGARPPYPPHPLHALVIWPWSGRQEHTNYRPGMGELRAQCGAGELESWVAGIRGVDQLCNE